MRREGGCDPKGNAASARPRVHLVPASAIIEASVAMAVGEHKYGAYNWRKTPGGVLASTYIAAALRHIYAWYNGEDRDHESGALHLGNAIASLSVLVDAIRIGNAVDDRPPACDHASYVRAASEALGRYLEEKEAEKGAG